MYKLERSDERIPFITKGLLEIKGVKCTCLVDNISTTGALIEVGASDQMQLCMGDVGTLKVLLLSPVNYICQVVRINSNQIGLHFIEQ